MPTLSICIPTYNRSKYLAALLDSIVAQDSPDLEVVICDDASPDDTAAVATAYKQKLRNLTFVRHQRNIGIDQNFLSVVEHATGEYVWLMGDDDKLEPEGVARVMEALESWHGISGLTVGVIDYDFDFTKRTGVRRMPDTQILEGVENVFTTMVEVLGFMSALVVNRDKWLAVSQIEETLNFKNYYIQVYILGRIIACFGDWGVLRTPCVGFRSGNDQFLAKLGWLDRLQVDILAYEQIAASLFGVRSAVFHKVQKRVFRCHVIARIVNAKTSQAGAPGPTDVLTLLFRHYWRVPAFWYLAVPMLLTPGWILRRARKLYQTLPALSGSARARRTSTARLERTPKTEF